MVSLTTIICIGICIIALIIGLTFFCIKIFRPGPVGPVGYFGPTGPTGSSATGPNIVGPTGPLGAMGPTGHPGSLGIVATRGCTSLGHGAQTLGTGGVSVNGMTYIFEATEKKDMTLTIPASNVNIGDIFTVYNMSDQKITFDINNQGFANEDSSANLGVYQINKTIRLALFFITAGRNTTTSKNINIMYSMLGSNHITS